MLSYSIYTEPISHINFSKKKVVNTINQYSYCIAEEDDQFKIALEESDILLPDGVGITVFHFLLNGKKIKKIAGADIHRYLLEKLNEKKGSCFYLGSSNETLELIRKRLQKEYPDIRSGSFSPPYKASFSIEENSQMIKVVNDLQPDVLFVGMTAPKQEKWVQLHKERLNTTLICSIGAVFDFYAGTIKRPGKFWIYIGLEWFIRLLKEPKRMSKRYLYYGPVFILYMLKEKTKQLIHKKRK